MVFYNILNHAHSGFRWLLLLFLLIIIVNALVKWMKRSVFNKTDQRMNVIVMSLAHLQLIIGLILYFISPKVIFEVASFKEPFYRFFLIEHLVLMIISIALITIGSVSAKRAETSVLKFKRTFFFQLIALVLILFAIPWPFQNYGTTWF